MATTTVINNGIEEFPVYTGPNANYYTVGGSVNPGESVDVIWQEGSYRFIEYTVDGTTTKKRGYVSSGILKNANLGAACPITNSFARYVHTSCTTYTGPGSKYAKTKTYDSLTQGRWITYLYPVKTNGYAYVEYVSNNISGAHVRAYVYANNLGTDVPS